MLQVTQRESAVLSAAIAVGSIHRNFENDRWPGAMPDNAELQRTISRRQYVNAMRLLRDRLADPEDAKRGEIALITCFLFICLELIQSDIMGAVNHLRSGLKILREQSKQASGLGSTTTVLKRSQLSESVVDQFMALFGRLDFQSTMFGENRPRILVIPPSNATASALWVPSTFENIREAREYLDTLASAVFAFRGYILHERACPGGAPSERSMRLKSRWAHLDYQGPDWENDEQLPAQQNDLEGRFAEWKKTFDKFIAKNIQILTPEDYRDVRVARIQHLVMIMLVKECLSTRQMFFDQYLDEFNEIVDLADALEREGPPLPSFSIVRIPAMLDVSILG